MNFHFAMPWGLKIAGGWVGGGLAGEGVLRVGYGAMEGRFSLASPRGSA